MFITSAVTASALQSEVRAPAQQSLGIKLRHSAARKQRHSSKSTFPPCFQPEPLPFYNSFLGYANVTSLAELRAASSETVFRANELMVFNSTYGASGETSPVVDGSIVPQLPAVFLAQGRRAKNVRSIFAGHFTDERFVFINPAIQNVTAFNNQLQIEVLPDVQPAVLDHITNTLYPPISSNERDLGLFFSNETSIGYNDSISRLATLQADFLLTSNAYALLKAFGINNSYAYLFEEGLGLHGEDTPYTLYNYSPSQDAYDIGLFTLPPYRNNRTMRLFSSLGLGISVADPAGKGRCEFSEQALFFLDASQFLRKED